MKWMNLSLLVTSMIALFPQPLHAQLFTRYEILPHVARDTDSFQTYIVVENRGDAAVDFILDARRQSGEHVWSGIIPVPAGATIKKTVTEVTEGQDADYLLFPAREGIFAGLIYEPQAKPSNAVYIPSVHENARRWRVYTADWTQNFDGFVVINNTCQATRITLKQHAQSGEMLAEADPIFLNPGEKTTLNLGTMFNPVANSFVELNSLLPVVTLGLKGSLDANKESSFLIGNLAHPYPSFEELRAELLKAREKWGQQSFNNAYRFVQSRRCFCSDTYTQDVVAEYAAGITSLTYREDESQVPISRVAHYKSVYELFSFIEDNLDEADVVEAEFHPELGYPTYIFIDFKDCLADEELTYVTSDLEAL